ncbi:MAG: glycosyltransferase [Bacteroidales bacterium]|nr:glycosyltransferase [Bacteroidales bacterium]
MRLSIVIPVYNVEKYLDRCLESCLAQEIPPTDYEIVLINDGSTDASLSVAQKWADAHSNIRIFSQQNGGLSRARNAGMEKALGDYLWFVDSDDAIALSCLGPFLERCEKERLDILVLGRCRITGGTPLRCEFSGEKTRTVYTGKAVMRRGWMHSVCAPFHLFRRGFLQENKLSFLPGYLHEDEAFTPVAFYLAQRVSFAGAIGYYAYSREGSIMTTPSPRRAHDYVGIAQMLDAYSAALPPKDRALFSERISLLLVQVFKQALSASPEERERLEVLLFEQRRLLGHFRRSKKPSFLLLGCFFSLFPKHAVALFGVLFRAGSRLGITASTRVAA